MKAVVIGAGAVGLNTAWQLAQRGWTVVVVDKGKVGDGASSRAAGIITGLLWSETGVAVRRLSLRLFDELTSRLTGYRFRAVGCLNLFHAEALQERESLLPLYARLGAPVEQLCVDEIRRRWPQLAPGDGLAGQFDPDGGYSEPDELLPALADDCQRRGVDVREGSTVTGFLEGGGRLTGITTAAGPIEADAVVCTSHVWTRALFRRRGRDLPLKHFVHQRFVTPPQEPAPQLPAVNAHPYGGYLRPALGDRLLVGVEAAHLPEHPVPDFGFRMSSLEIAQDTRRRASQVLPLVPHAGAADWQGERIGLLCFSADGEPLLGPVADVPGLFVGTAFHSGGFAYSPAAGQLLAELVSDGSPSIDLSAFSPDRFEVDEVDHFLSTEVTHAQYSDSIPAYVPRKF